MKVKSVIEISPKEKESLDIIYDLMSDIDDNDVARATVQRKVLDDYDLTVGDIKDILSDLDDFFKLED